MRTQILPILLRLSYDGHPLQYSGATGWTYKDADGQVCRPRTESKKRIHTLLGNTYLPDIVDGRLSSAVDNELIVSIASGDNGDSIEEKLMSIADKIAQVYESDRVTDPWLSQLDWTEVSVRSLSQEEQMPSTPPAVWPKWYWELTKPRKDAPPGSLNLTVRTRFAPLLLRLSWLGWPLFYSREHGWTFRVDPNSSHQSRLKPLKFYHHHDEPLRLTTLQGYRFYKLDRTL